MCFVWKISQQLLRSWGHEGVAKPKAGDPSGWRRVCSSYITGIRTYQADLYTQRRVFRRQTEKETHI